MSLLNSMFAGVSGLRNHQTMLDLIGNNIANVNSIGYKGSRVTFSDTFNQFVRFGSNPTENSGGTNTFQVGLGMKIGSIDRNWNQGTFERSGILTDLALQGKGLFVLKNNGQQFFSRAGAFTFDADGKLVVPQNGAVVQGKVATDDGIIPPGNHLEDVQIKPNMKLPAVSTTLATWGGNLSSTSSITRSEEYVEAGNINSSLPLEDLTAVPPVPAGTATDTNTIYDDNGNEYTLTSTYTKTAANTYDLTYDIINKETGDSIYVAPATPPAAVSMVFDGTTGALTTMGGAAPAAIAITDTDLGLNFTFDPTTVTQTNSATTLNSTVDSNREPTIVTGTVTVFDSLGNSHSLTLKFTKLSNLNWNWSATIPASSGTLSNNTGTVSFNADGSMNTPVPNPPVLAFAPLGGASANNITLDFGSGFEGITQSSTDSVVSALSQNGSSAATLSDLSIDQYGFIVGVFSNGYSKKLAQIMLASFPNLGGLTSVGDNLYTVSANSGDPLYGVPGEETGTTIQSGALEQSNVDLSEEFTRMIVAQRGFQANARTITVSDTLLQEITSLVR
ncbi:MAG: flagellar hook protein FlgE [Ignavibacteriales bacterium]|nr:flagellar hook protein FlgE [Ignavibacteriales bacterium]